MSELWEPWTPRPGARVRIRLSGECPLHDGGAMAENYDGRLGVVIGPVRQPPQHPDSWLSRYPGHVWEVRFARYRLGGVWGAHFAAAELEPLEAADARD